MIPAKQTLPLFPDSFRPRRVEPAPVCARPASAAPLWLCLHLPALPLEVGAAAGKSGPWAVVEQQGGRQFIVAVNDCAAREGVEPGQPLTSAYVLIPPLEVLERDPRGERAALERIAVWAGRWTSRVSLEPPAAVLLEIRGSLRLFGGLATLRGRVAHDLQALGYAGRQGVAPTPLGALWLARAGDTVPVEHTRDLACRLGRLTLGSLGWPAKVQADLRGMGVRRVKDCLRLPRAGFARRFGPERLAELDRALGRSPDPRLSHASAPGFEEALELPAEVSDTELLLEAARRLLDGLGDFLRAREGGVRRLELACLHAGQKATALDLRLSMPSGDPDHLCALLAARLEGVRLPAPVLALRLRSGFVWRLRPVTCALPMGTGTRVAREALPKLVERLRARLGAEAVFSLRAVADHRPEIAWRFGDIPHWRPPMRNVPKAAALKRGQTPKRGLTPISPRPLWMLDEPQRLAPARGSWPGLRLESGPERIETGWWDGGDVARDYYVAIDARGRRLWIFRRRFIPRHWFLHGIFG